MNREEALDFLVKEVSFWSGGGFGVCGWWFEDSVFCHQEHAAITIDDWNRAKIKPNTKIRIESAEHSEYIESLLDGCGIKFGEDELESGNPYNYDFLNIFTGNIARYGTDNVRKEIFIELPKTKEHKPCIAEGISNLTISHECATIEEINAKVLAEKVGSKYDQGKPRYDLIPVHAEAEFVDVLTFGATKYGAENWRKVEDAKTRYQAALGRHIAAYRMGETYDLESGKHHLAHAMCCLAFIIELDLEDRQ